MQQARTSLPRKRGRTVDYTDSSDDDQPMKIPRPNAIFTCPLPPKATPVIAEDDEPDTFFRGTGTKTDPWTLSSWMTGNVIAHVDQGPILLDSDEDEEVEAFSLHNSFDDEESDTSSITSYETAAESPTPARLFIRSASSPTEYAPCSIDNEEDFDDPGNREDKIANSDHDSDGQPYSIVIDLDGEDDDTAIRRISAQIEMWKEWSESNLVKPEPHEKETFELETPVHEEESVTSNENSGAPYSPAQDLCGCSSDNVQARSPISMQPSSIVSGQGIPQQFSAEQIKEHEDMKAYIKFKKWWLYHKYAARMTKGLELKMKNVMKYVRMPDKDQDNNCWIYERSQGGNSNSICIAITFEHEGLKHRLTQNFGTINMFLQGKLTTDIIDKFIEKWWHLSHLCGNWRCVNINHVILEARETNIRRNACFRAKEEARRPYCQHDPPCMTHLTNPILPEDRRIKRGIKLVTEELRPGLL
ncbi:hypothetical protein CC80DRAFT_552107 [Byssothecium circinans]|uniref:Zinc-binding loop region of homing endonuclease domain-containing protein n=1 Tax=Byssothecium circinans TaxID=147558 RepID=A0A6A5TJ05_9PLEO|nr:hypothetical protein CC80DRAFT_552107 [Byssothecium circinans]